MQPVNPISLQEVSAQSRTVNDDVAAAPERSVNDDVAAPMTPIVEFCRKDSSRAAPG
jgi:hypothetical protein